MSRREQMKQTLEQMAFPVYEGRDHLGSKCPETAATTLTVVFLGSDIELETALKPLKAWKATGKPMIFIFSEVANQILSVSQLTKRFKPSKTIVGQPFESLKALVQGSSQVYIPNLTQNTAAKLAVGIQDNFITTFLWQCLAMNKTMYANTAGIERAWFDIKTNPMMAKTMQGHLVVLKQYGLQTEMPEWGIGSEGVKQGTSQIAGAKALSYTILSDALSQKVITERHIMSLEKGSRLAVKKGVKITPLARETAKKRKIELLQMEEGNNL